MLAGWLFLRRELRADGRRTIVEWLLEDPAVLEAAEAYSREHGVPLSEAFRRAERYAWEISPSPDSGLYFRVGVPLAGLVVRFLYGNRLRSGGEENVPKAGGETGVVFVINHRSNLDYVILGHLIGKKAALSFASGEWASFWPLGPLVRAMGSFFVRRGSGDALHRRVLERFVQRGLEGGLTPAIFVEGGLSRDGRLHEPKTGLLDYALRRFDLAGERDLLFVPAAINYDWVLEDGSLRALGEPHPSGVRSVFSTLFFILRRIRLAQRSPDRLGHAAVRFGTPVSTRGWARSRNVDFRTLEPEARVGRVREFALDLMESVGKLVPIVSVPIVARVLLEASEEALAREEILSRSWMLVSELERRGAWGCFEGDAAIEAALRILVLRRMVVQQGDGYRTAPESVKLLRFYAASISHFLPEESSKNDYSGSRID